jgi:hypothetical protein
MKPISIAACLASVAVTLAQPASALTIDLFDMGGLAQGTPQYQAFRTAANYWQSIITTQTTVRVNMSFYGQGVNGPIGGTSNYYYVGNVETIIDAMKNVASTSPVDVIAVSHLPDASSGSIGMWTPGYTLGNTGANPYTSVYDNDGSRNNSSYGVTWALGKALGLVTVDNAKDGSINFNSDLNFDFDPTDGISPGSYDFTFTAFHELGHILGFTSGVDYYDSYASPTRTGYNWNYDWIGHGMDIYRYSDKGLDWSLGGNPYFSIDGGDSALLDGHFSTGVNWGNGRQASHWLEGEGIMDPTSARGEMGALTALDVAAFDALGWNLNIDALADPNLRITTAQMVPVPEPSIWAMMIVGFGAIGATLRRKRRDRSPVAA